MYFNGCAVKARFVLNKQGHSPHVQYCGAETCRLDKTGHAGILGLPSFLLDVLLLTQAVVELKSLKECLAGKSLYEQLHDKRVEQPGSRLHPTAKCMVLTNTRCTSTLDDRSSE